MNEVEKIVRSFSKIDFLREYDHICKTEGFLGTGTRDKTLANSFLWRKFYIPDSFYGHRLAAGVSILSEYLGLDHPDIFSTDSWGVARNDVLSDESEARVRTARERGQLVVAVLGGSTVQGVGAGCPRFTIPSILERLLSIHYKIEAVCINHGVAGWSSADQLHFLIHGLEYHPDICIFYDGWNCCWSFYQMALLGAGLASGRQFEDAILWRRGVSPRHLEHEEINRLAFSFPRLIERAALLAGQYALTLAFRPLDLFSQGQSKRLAGRLLPIGTFDPLIQVRELELNPILRDRILRITAEEFLRVHSLAGTVCKDRGIKFIHFLQPLLVNSQKKRTLSEDNLLHREGLMRNPEIFSLFPGFVSRGNHDTKLIDLSTVFDDSCEEVFLDGGHLNRFGNYMVAVQIANKITLGGMIRP